MSHSDEYAGNGGGFECVEIREYTALSAQFGCESQNALKHSLLI